MELGKSDNAKKSWQTEKQIFYIESSIKWFFNALSFVTEVLTPPCQAITISIDLLIWINCREDHFQLEI